MGQIPYVVQASSKDESIYIIVWISSEDWSDIIYCLGKQQISVSIQLLSNQAAKTGQIPFIL